MASDALQRSTPARPTRPPYPTREKPIGNAGVDKLTDALGAQGFVQDASRSAAKLLEAVGRPSRVAGAVSAIAAGEAGEIDRDVAAGVAGVGRVAKAVAPARAVAVTRVATPVGTALGATLCFLGKAGPIVSIPFAFYDVAKAWTEPDRTKKDAAWMNASLTVGGTALGVLGVFASTAAVAVPVLVGSAAIALFQLADTYAWDGRRMDWLGAHVMHPLRTALGR